MNKIEAILILLSDKNNPIIGTTRLQKEVFLSENEKGITFDDGSFDFEAYKFGPYSKNLKDEIDFLVNAGLITKSGENDINKNVSIDNLDELNALDFLTSEIEADIPSYDEIDGDEYIIENLDDSIIYRITDKGLNFLEQLNIQQTAEAKAVNSVKKQYRNMPIIRLLQYVYSKYPEYATESEIKSNIL